MAFLKEEIKAGIIVVSALTIISLMVVLIGGTQLFEKFDTYYVKLTDIAGIDAGSQVRLGGVRIGMVKDIIVPDKPNAPVTLVLSINKGTPIYKGTKGVISQIGFVGDIYMGLSNEHATSERLPVGSTIPAEERIQLSDLLFKLGKASDTLDTLLRDVDLLFAEKNRKEIGSLLTNTNNTVLTMQKELVDISSTLTNTTKKLYDVLGNIDNLLKENKGEVNRVLTTATKDLEDARGMIKSIEKTADSFNHTSKTIDKAVNSQSENISRVITTLDATMEDLQDVLQEIKHKPWSFIYREDGGKHD
ncbi:MAG: MCE family protein [Nitrospirae bacterium]|nr:MCE family protein [Nitrospirota bacterium]